MKIADEYFNNCRKIVTNNSKLNTKRVRYNVFTRESGVLVGANKAVNFIKENTYGPLLIKGLKDGLLFDAKQSVLIYEGNFEELVTLETTVLGFLSFSGAATSMLEITTAAGRIPVIDMSARHYPWRLIEELALAAYYGGAKGTSTEAGYDYVKKWTGALNFGIYASLPHAMAAILYTGDELEDLEKITSEDYLFPSVKAARLFNLKFPEKPITVLADYEGQELDVATQAFKLFGNKLFAVRLDTHGERYMQGCPSREVIPMLSSKGVSVESTIVMRKHLDSIGAKNVKIVVSSGFNKDKVAFFVRHNVPIDFIGTGSWVKFSVFTADITHFYKDNEWIFCGKIGRQWDNGDKLPILFERR